VTGWAQALHEAERAKEDFPQWWVRAVRRRDGVGIEAIRDGRGLCSVTGSVAEVRAVLAATAEDQQLWDIGRPLEAVPPQDAPKAARDGIGVDAPVPVALGVELEEAEHAIRFHGCEQARDLRRLTGHRRDCLSGQIVVDTGRPPVVGLAADREHCAPTASGCSDSRGWPRRQFTAARRPQWRSPGPPPPAAP
jgi:hypothetical protein